MTKLNHLMYYWYTYSSWNRTLYDRTVGTNDQLAKFWERRHAILGEKARFLMSKLGLPGSDSPVTYLIPLTVMTH
jgi:hypothetical protein